MVTLLFLTNTLVEQTHTINIYTEDLPLLQFVEKGEQTGFAVELVKRIQAISGIRGVIYFYPWARAYKQAQGETNALLFSTRKTQFRAKHFRWARAVFAPGYQTWYATPELMLLCQHNSGIKITALADAHKYSLIGQRGDFLHEFAEYDLQWPLEKLVMARDFDDVLSMLSKGRGDLILLAKQDYQEVLTTRGYRRDEFKVCHTLQSPDLPFYFAFSLRTEAQIIERFNQAYDSLLKNGEYRRLYAKWDKRAKAN